jgi:hypothetical protein
MSRQTYTFDNPVGSSGTELNPYEPVTYNDLLAAIQTQNLYVKLTKNFDFKESPAYRYGLSGELHFDCAKLYADNADQSGTKYYISGLVINGDLSIRCAFYMNGSTATSSGCLVDNIAFINCCLNGGNTSSTMYDAFISRSNSSTTQPFTFNNCQFSLLIRGTYFVTFVYHISNNGIIVNNCSAYIKFVSSNNCFGANGLLGSYALESMTGCTFQLYVNRNQFSANIGWPIYKNLSNCTAYLKLNDYTSGIISGTYNVFGSGDNHSCYIIDIVRCGDAQTLNCGVNMTGTGVSILDKDLLDNAGVTISATGTHIKLLTTQQMKDEDYLVDIGFLP